MEALEIGCCWQQHGNQWIINWYINKERIKISQNYIWRSRRPNTSLWLVTHRFPWLKVGLIKCQAVFARASVYPSDSAELHHSLPLIRLLPNPPSSDIMHQMDYFTHRKLKTLKTKTRICHLAASNKRICRPLSPPPHGSCLCKRVWIPGNGIISVNHLSLLKGQHECNILKIIIPKIWEDNYAYFSRYKPSNVGILTCH